MGVMWLIALMVWGGGQPVAWTALATEAVEPFERGGAGKDAVPVRIHVRNQMSKRLRLVEAKVVLDETEVVHEAARPGEELERSFTALETEVPPGQPRADRHPGLRGPADAGPAGYRTTTATGADDLPVLAR